MRTKDGVAICDYCARELTHDELIGQRVFLGLAISPSRSLIYDEPQALDGAELSRHSCPDCRTPKEAT